MDHLSDCSGIWSCNDVYDCDVSLMQDEAAIRRLVRELCDLIQMRRFGETQVARRQINLPIGDAPRIVGWHEALTKPAHKKPLAPRCQYGSVRSGATPQNRKGPRR